MCTVRKQKEEGKAKEKFRPQVHRAEITSRPSDEVYQPVIREL
jgi:hypothetical protein